MREQRRVGGEDDDQGTVVLFKWVLAAGKRRILFQVLTYWNARDRELIAPPKIGLDKRADPPAAQFIRELARGRPGATFEFIAQHSRPTAHVALGNRSLPGSIQRLPDMLSLDVESIHIVEPAIGGFGDHRTGPALVDCVVLRLPVDDRIADDANRMGVRDADGTFQHAAFLHPGGTRDFAVAVEGKCAGEDGFMMLPPARVDDG